MPWDIDQSEGMNALGTLVGFEGYLERPEPQNLRAAEPRNLGGQRSEPQQKPEPSRGGQASEPQNHSERQSLKTTETRTSEVRAAARTRDQPSWP